MPAPATPTCLFTEEPLTADTREEHTIQRSLGGRICSRLVSSTSFNERSGGVVDNVIAQLYADVMSVLGPVLPVECLGGDRPVELVGGAAGRYAVTNQGQLTMRGTSVVERDAQTGRPTAVLGVDEGAIRRIIDQNIQPGAVERRRMELPPAQEGVFPSRPVLCTEIEIAALKAVLLTFEHLLQGDPERFTWDDSLARIRSAVRQMVMNQTPIDAALLIDTVLGLQYDQDMLDLYRQLRESVAFPETPFEHVVLASANPGSHVLDVVFWAYRTDPYAFRFAGWRGPGFTYVVVNGILRGTSSSEAYRLPDNHLLGRPTMRRSNLLVKRHPTAAEREAIHNEIFQRRSGLYREAVDYVERNCDELVSGNLERWARLNPTADRSLRGAIRSRLQLFYGRRLGDDAAQQEFAAICDAALAQVPEVLLPADGGGDAPDWGYWLPVYRAALHALRERFGLPGEQFIAGGLEIASQGGDRVLGNWPPNEPRQLPA